MNNMIQNVFSRPRSILRKYFCLQAHFQWVSLMALPILSAMWLLVQPNFYLWWPSWHIFLRSSTQSKPLFIQMSQLRRNSHLQWGPGKRLTPPQSSTYATSIQMTSLPVYYIQAGNTFLLTYCILYCKVHRFTEANERNTDSVILSCVLFILFYFTPYKPFQ